MADGIGFMYTGFPATVALSTKAANDLDYNYSKGSIVC
jgi:hypothetical protein